MHYIAWTSSHRNFLHFRYIHIYHVSGPVSDHPCSLIKHQSKNYSISKSLFTNVVVTTAGGGSRHMVQRSSTEGTLTVLCKTLRGPPMLYRILMLGTVFGLPNLSGLVHVRELHV